MFESIRRNFQYGIRFIHERFKIGTTNVSLSESLIAKNEAELSRQYTARQIEEQEKKHEFSFFKHFFARIPFQVIAAVNLLMSPVIIYRKFHVAEGKPADEESNLVTQCAVLAGSGICVVFIGYKTLNALYRAWLGQEQAPLWGDARNRLEAALGTTLDGTLTVINFTTPFGARPSFKNVLIGVISGGIVGAIVHLPGNRIGNSNTPQLYIAMRLSTANACQDAAWRLRMAVQRFFEILNVPISLRGAGFGAMYTALVLANQGNNNQYLAIQTALDVLGGLVVITKLTEVISILKLTRRENHWYADFAKALSYFFDIIILPVATGYKFLQLQLDEDLFVKQITNIPSFSLTQIIWFAVLTPAVVLLDMYVAIKRHQAERKWAAGDYALARSKYANSKDVEQNFETASKQDDVSNMAQVFSGMSDAQIEGILKNLAEENRMHEEQQRLQRQGYEAQKKEAETNLTVKYGEVLTQCFFGRVSVPANEIAMQPMTSEVLPVKHVNFKLC